MKLGIAGKMLGDGKALVGKNAKGMEGKEGAEKGKGAALTEDGGLLAGVGYNTVDHKSSKKNVAERANLERFLQEMGPETAQERPQLGEKAEAKETQGKDKGDGEAKAKGETKEAPNEPARAEAQRETAEDGHVLGQAETQEAVEGRETKEAEEAEGEHQGGKGQGDDEDERDKPGGGWVAEELDERDEEKVALRSPEALADQHRCRASLGDGNRCLRRSVKGSQYCREHFVPPTGPVST